MAPEGGDIKPVNPDKDTKDEGDGSDAGTTLRAKGEPVELENAPPELNPNVVPGQVRPDLAPGVDDLGKLRAFDRAALEKQVGGLTDLHQGLTDPLTGTTIGSTNGPGIDEMLKRAGEHGLKSESLRDLLPDRHTDDNAPPKRTGGHDPRVASGLPEYVPPKDAQEKIDKMNKDAQDKRDASEKFKKDKAEFEKRQYEEPKPKEYDTGEGGPVPSWVPDGTGGQPVVNKGDWVSKPVNPDGPGGDVPTVDPSTLPPKGGGGVDPGVVDKDPDYQEVSVPSSPPAVKPGDTVSKPVNPDDIDPGLPPGTGPPPRGGGETDGPPGKGPSGPEGNPDSQRGAPVGVVAEPAPNQVAPPAPPPVVAQDAPKVDVGDDFSGPPVGAGAAVGEGPPEGDIDGDGVPDNTG